MTERPTPIAPQLKRACVAGRLGVQAALILTAASLLSGTCTVPCAAEAATVDGGATTLEKGRRALWGGEAENAVSLLGSYVASHPADRAALVDFGFACAWTARYAQAYAAFQRSLAGDHALDAHRSPAIDGEGARSRVDAAPPVPAEDLAVRALTGTADVLKWSGRPAEALRARRRALALRPDDAELRAQVEEGDRAAEPFARATSRYMTDSDARMLACTRLALDAGEANGGLWIAAFDHTRLNDTRRNVRVEEYGLAFGRRQLLGAGLSGEVLARVAAAGAASPVEESDGARFGCQLALERHGFRGPSLTLRLSESDRWTELESTTAQAKGVHGFEAALSGYQGVAKALGVWAQVRSGALSDGNAYACADVSVDRMLAPGLGAGVGLRAIDYREASDGYYAAQDETSAQLALRGDRTLGAFGLHGVTGAGYGRNHHGSGPLYRLEGSLDGAHLGPLTATVGFLYAESIQTTTYIARTWSAMVRLH